MRNTFNAWFRVNYPESKSEWPWKVHDTFHTWYNKTHEGKCRVSVRDINTWLKKLGIIVADRNNKGQKLRKPQKVAS